MNTFPQFLNDDDAFLESVHRYLDGDLSAEDAKRLVDMLRTETTRRKQFVAICLSQEMIAELETPDHLNFFEETHGVDEERYQIVAELLEQDRVARLKEKAEAALEKQQQATRDAERHALQAKMTGLNQPQSASSTKHYVIPKPLFYGSIAAVIAVVAAIIWPLIDHRSTQIAPDGSPIKTGPVEVGRIATQQNARWLDEARSTTGTLKLYDQPMTLLEGFVELEFKSGAKVIVQAPAAFHPLSADRLAVQSGRITGRCDDLDQPFIVETPTARVIDIGTEFGVTSFERNGTNVRVFEGVVEIAPPEDTSKQEAIRLIRGQAGGIDAIGKIWRRSSVDSADYIRDLGDNTSIGIPGVQLDLADVVGGGTGFGGGAFGVGVDPRDGQFSDRKAESVLPANFPFRRNESPLIDGAFVPHNDAKLQKLLSSTGIEYEGISITTPYAYGVARNGGRENFYTFGGLVPIEAILDGKNFTTQPGEHSSIAMHANIGVTFDLEAIRRSMPGTDVTSLNALAGISQAASEIAMVERQDEFDLEILDANVTILVDGQTKLNEVLKHGAKATLIDVPLEPNDRFLTIIVSDGDSRGWNYADFVVLGDPVLKLKSKSIADG